MLEDDELAERVEQDFRSAGLDDRRAAMLEYVAKLTREPKQVRREDVERLRQVGFGDVDILAICEVTSYYAYVNRIANGLGVELEDA